MINNIKEQATFTLEKKGWQMQANAESMNDKTNKTEFFARK